MTTLNTDAIVDAIIAAPSVTSPLAREAGSSLVDAWIQRNFERDSRLRPLLVEAGFIWWADDHTAVIGVQDLVAEDAAGIVAGEWKSAKEPKRNKDGSDSAWWNEDVWLEEITRGPQVAIYAVAQFMGTYYEQGRPSQTLNIARPRIMVRAAVKSNPPRFWPSEGDGVFEFPKTALDATIAAVRNKAAQIRASRATNTRPWQLTGRHCRQFNRDCQYLDMCLAHQHPPLLELTAFDKADPAAQLALPHIDPVRLADPELVILSASSYDAASVCLEKYRLLAGSIGEKENDLALQTGSAMHAGLAAFYRQLREVKQ